MTVLHDKNKIPDLLEALENLKSKELHVGVLSSEASSEMLMIARVHEYGVTIEVTEKMRAFLHYAGLHLRADTTEVEIPERSFIRSTFDDDKDEIENMAVAFLGQVLSLEISAKQFYDKLGRFIQSKIQRKIRDVRTPPNHPFTIDKKGTTNPLIAGGHLRRNITWEVKDV